MTDYLRVARIYLSGTTVAVWSVLLLCLLGVSTAGQELASSQGGILGGVLSRKSYMAMFVYFNACLFGVLLRDNIAHPWASVLPRYRQKHLLVMAFIALCCLGIPMFSMGFVGTNDIAPTSVAVIFLTCLAGGLWTLHHPLLGFLAVPFLVFTFARASSFPALAAFLAGTTPVTSATLVVVSLLALGVLAWRLLVLNEEKLEYGVARLWGDLFRGRGQIVQGQATTFSDYLATLPADQRAALQNRDQLNGAWTNLKHVDNLTGYSERSLWRRSQLWRLGTASTRTSVSVGGLLLLTLFIIPLMMGVEDSARDIVVIFSVQVMANPVTLWLPWFLGLQRLGYESLKPRTRPEFIRELGLTLLWDVIQCWLGGILCLGIAAAIWAPELLQVNNIILFIFCTGVGQLCAFAVMGIWALKRRSTAANTLFAFGQFMAMVSWILFVAMNSHINFAVNLIIASVLATAAMATIALAYRRWCRADLG